jgi:hypothetical protein
LYEPKEREVFAAHFEDRIVFRAKMGEEFRLVIKLVSGLQLFYHFVQNLQKFALEHPQYVKHQN